MASSGPSKQKRLNWTDDSRSVGTIGIWVDGPTRDHMAQVGRWLHAVKTDDAQPFVRAAALCLGERLYNGICLPRVWPPAINLTRAVRTPPYLVAPPPVIEIDIGWQLLVDNFLIDREASTVQLQRHWGVPRWHQANPVLRVAGWQAQTHAVIIPHDLSLAAPRIGRAAGPAPAPAAYGTSRSSNFSGCGASAATAVGGTAIPHCH